MANEHRPHRPNLYSRDGNDQSIQSENYSEHYSERSVVLDGNENTSPNLPRFSVDSSMIPPMLSSMLSGSSLSGLGVSGDSDSNRLRSRLAPPLIPLPLVLMLAACADRSKTSATSAKSETSETPDTTPMISTVSKSGYVYDGPIEGAAVYVDVDGDGELDRDDGDGIWEEGEDYLVGRSNAQGRFEGVTPTQYAGKRYIVDLSRATDRGENPDSEDDDKELSGVWLAPEGATVISALTHLMTSGLITKEEVEEYSPGFDPLHAWFCTFF